MNWSRDIPEHKSYASRLTLAGQGIAVSKSGRVQFTNPDTRVSALSTGVIN